MILVTGGTGLLGSHLLMELTARYDKIRAIRRPASNITFVRNTFSLNLENHESRFSKIEWAEGDICDYDSIINTLEGVDTVYHLAASVSFNPGDHLRMIKNNVSGTANLVNACLEKKIRRFCFASSTAALGDAPAGEEITEEMLWKYSKSRSAYSVSKFKSEMEVWRGMAEGLDAVIVNPSIIIGAGDWKRSSSYLFTAVWKGLKFYSKGITGYVDIRDVVRALIQLAESDVKGERFIVSAENLSYRTVLEMIANALGKKPPRFYASRFLTEIGWRTDWLVSMLTGKNRMITRDAARSSNRKALFSNHKVIEATGIEFTPVAKSIEQTAQVFLSQHSAQ